MAEGSEEGTTVPNKKVIDNGYGSDEYRNPIPGIKVKDIESPYVRWKATIKLIVRIAEIINDELGSSDGDHWELVFPRDKYWKYIEADGMLKFEDEDHYSWAGWGHSSDCNLTLWVCKQREADLERRLKALEYNSSSK